MSVKIVQFIAIVLTALALVPGGAHVLSLPNKICLPQEPYFVVQKIYRGWQFVGVVLVGALVADSYLAFALRGGGAPFWLSLGGVLCLAASLLAFFIWVLPANLATDNWLSTPPEWQALRRRWEYGHAAGAALILAALCLVVASTLATTSDAGGLAD